MLRLLSSASPRLHLSRASVALVASVDLALLAVHPEDHKIISVEKRQVRIVLSLHNLIDVP